MSFISSSQLFRLCIAAPSPQVDCLQSAFSLKIRLVLISSSAIPNHDVIITETDEKEKSFFFSVLRPRFSRLPASPLACSGFACSNFAKKNKRLLEVYPARGGRTQATIIQHILEIVTSDILVLPP